MANYYVTVNGAGLRDGSDWSNAFRGISTGGGDSFEEHYEGNAAPGDIYYIEAGTYTATSNIDAVTQDGTAASPITIIGVKSGTTNEPPVYSDWSIDDGDRPDFALGAWYFKTGQYHKVYNLDYTTTASLGVQRGRFSFMGNCRSNNSSESANRYAFFSVSDSAEMMDCEAISTNGIAIDMGGNDTLVWCYLHDSVYGVASANWASVWFCIIDTCTTGIYLAAVVLNTFVNNTIYNCTTGISGTTGYSGVIINNIINDCATGASWTTNTLINEWDYNNWEGNTADTSNVTKGNNATANDPEFDNAANGDFGLGDNEGSCIGAAFAGILGGMGV